MKNGLSIADLNQVMETLFYNQKKNIKMEQVKPKLTTIIMQIETEQTLIETDFNTIADRLGYYLIEKFTYFTFDILTPDGADLKATVTITTPKSEV